MRLAALTLLAFLSLAIEPAVAADAPPTGPPEWFREHLAYMTAGDGAWRTDNSAYKSEDEPADAYEVTYIWGAGKQTAVGSMRSIKDGKRSGVIWEYRVFWDPGAKKAMIQQHSFWGAYGIGETKFVDPKRLRSEQTFYAPDGSESRTAHDWVTDSPTQHTTNTSSFEDGAWKPGRTYVWKRAAAPRTKG
jgi:hypothetical protein